MLCLDSTEYVRKLKGAFMMIGLFNLFVTIFNYQGEEPFEDGYVALIIVSFGYSLLCFIFTTTESEYDTIATPSNRLILGSIIYIFYVCIHFILGAFLVILGSAFISHIQQHGIICQSIECKITFAKRIASGGLSVIHGVGFGIIGSLSVHNSGNYQIIN